MEEQKISLRKVLNSSNGIREKMELREHFLREVEESFPVLEEACRQLFGDEKSLLGRAQQLLPFDKYVFSHFSSPVPETSTYLLAAGNQDTLFGVRTDLEGEIKFSAGTAFIHKPSKIVTSPLLLFPEKGVQHHAQKYQRAGIDWPYFYIWLHEYSHYLVYLLQEVPYQAATNLLLFHLQEEGITGSLSEVIGVALKEKREVGMVLYSLLETMESSGVYLQDCLIREMGIPSAPHPESGIYQVFSKLPFWKFIDNVERWHLLQAERSPYLQDFWREFITIPIEKVAAE